MENLKNTPDQQQSNNEQQGGGDNQSSNTSHIIQAPSISLPKGGGAIRGMGEKFAANPVTGTGSMTVPIATHPGRYGFSPQLSLSYGSGSGNGPFGFGWNLSIPQITWKTDPDEPRISHALTLEVDEYVNVLKSASIAYGHRQNPSYDGFTSEGQNKQRQIHISSNENTFSEPYIAGQDASEQTGSMAIGLTKFYPN